MLLAVVVVVVVVVICVMWRCVAVRSAVGRHNERRGSGQAEGWRGCAGAGDVLQGLRTTLEQARAQGQVW